MLTAMMVIFCACCFCAVFQESRIRDRQYKEHGFSAFFKTEFEQTYEIRSSEVFIGSGKNADIRIHIPGVDRKKNRWWGQRRLAGIKEIHALCRIEGRWTVLYSKSVEAISDLYGIRRRKNCDSSERRRGKAVSWSKACIWRLQADILSRDGVKDYEKYN